MFGPLPHRLHHVGIIGIRYHVTDESDPTPPQPVEVSAVDTLPGSGNSDSFRSPLTIQLIGNAQQLTDLTYGSDCASLHASLLCSAL
jgi:hypothetical protein